MNRVLIVGAGGVGRVVTHKCAQQPEVFGEIMLASRTKAKCDAIAADVKERTGREVRTAALDADDVAATTELLEAYRPKVLINVALPYQDLALMDACLNVGVHYLDTANYEPRDTPKFEYKWQWAYRERFKKAGLMALLGSGFDPGVTNVFCARASKHLFDRIDTIDIIDCNAGDHGLPFATNFNPEINLREITARGRWWRDGEWLETEPLSDSREFVFPRGIGAKNIFLLYHEEMESLAVNIPNVRQLRFWMTFSEQYLTHLRVLEAVGMTSIEPISFNGQKIAPLEFLKAVLPEPASLGPLTKGKTCIGCIVRGEYDGVPRSSYIFNTCVHEEAFAETGAQAISYTTGVPASVGARMMLEGKWMKPGVWNMEEMDPDPFLEALGESGLPWEEETIDGEESSLLRVDDTFPTVPRSL
ncbi:MAG: saccharopine dehydrogenase family protein [Verrucomicrobiales bacterium]|nr:saccharopine dehydrogenase family protein [Verrucomicrobiales bacterium]